MNATCGWVRGRLSRLLDGELPEAQRRAAERHLAGCTACRAEREALRALRAGWRAAAGPPSLAADRAAIMAAAEPLLAAAARGERRAAPRVPAWPAARRGAFTRSDLVTVGALAVSLVLLLVLRQPAPRAEGFRPRSAAVLTLAERTAREAGQPIEAAGAWVMSDPFQWRDGGPSRGRVR